MNPEKCRALAKQYRDKNIERARKQSKESYERHKEKRLTGQKKYYEENREKRNEYSKKYQKENRARLVDYYRQYRQSDMPGAIRMRKMSAEYCRRNREKNPEKYKAQNRLRESKRRANSNSKIDISLDDLFFQSDGLCPICGGVLLMEDVEIDHTIPLSRGGKHTEDNLRAIHSWCNRSKNSKLDDEITLQQSDRLREKTIEHLGHVHMIEVPD